MNNKTAIFYSKNNNNVLASKVREILNKFNFFTAYLNEVDDILLKKLNYIDMLILDYTESTLDKKSKELIKKLNEELYIKRIIVIEGNNLNQELENPVVIYDENFCLNFLDTVKNILSKPLEEKRISFSFWFKIIGNYLKSIGFSLKQTGYSMMVDAIIYIMSKRAIVGSLNEDIYVFLANKYNKKVSCVEMNLRKSIRIAFERGENFPFEYCPTNKEFLNFAITELYDKIFIKDVI